VACDGRVVLNDFRLCAPESLEEACAFLAEHGADAAVYAGGTELLLAMKEGLAAPDYLVDVKPLRLAGIGVDADSGELRLGATATHREVEAFCEANAPWRVLAELERRVANVRVRNQGTIGGNLCFGEPHADPGTLLTAWDAAVELADVAGRRRVAIGEFLVDEFATALEDGEVMTAVVVPPQPDRSASAYQRFGFLERPTLGVAARIALDPDGEHVSEAWIAVGAVGPCPQRLNAAERVLLGAGIEGRAWADGVELASAHAGEACTASGDSHGSEDYKRHLVRVFVRRALEACRVRVTADAGREGGRT
jgi:carbon-monoxide dehydrogenase medium subunit